MKLLRNRGDIQIKPMRDDIAKLLETGLEATVRILFGGQNFAMQVGGQCQLCIKFWLKNGVELLYKGFGG
ncbi:hypothetical protein POUND7_008880 [Theobroma cacao]